MMPSPHSVVGSRFFCHWLDLTSLTGAQSKGGEPAITSGNRPSLASTIPAKGTVWRMGGMQGTCNRNQEKMRTFCKVFGADALVTRDQSTPLNHAAARRNRRGGIPRPSTRRSVEPLHERRLCRSKILVLRILDCLLNGSEMRDRTRTLNGVRAMFVPLLVCFLEPAPIFVPERPHEIKVLALLFGRGIKALAPIFGCRIF